MSPATANVVRVFGEAENMSLHEGARTAIFIGIFFLAVLFAIVWWLRR